MGRELSASLPMKFYMQWMCSHCGKALAEQHMQYCKWLKQKTWWKPKELLPGKTHHLPLQRLTTWDPRPTSYYSILAWSQLLRNWQWKGLLSAPSKRLGSESRSFLCEGWVASSHIKETLVTRLLRSSFGNRAKGWLNMTDKLLSWLCPYRNWPQPLPRG